MQSPVSRSWLLATPGRFTVNTTGPIMDGNCIRPFSWSRRIEVGATVAAKSTWRSATFASPSWELVPS